MPKNEPFEPLVAAYAQAIVESGTPKPLDQAQQQRIAQEIARLDADKQKKVVEHFLVFAGKLSQLHGVEAVVFQVAELVLPLLHRKPQAVVEAFDAQNIDLRQAAVTLGLTPRAGGEDPRDDSGRSSLVELLVDRNQSS